MICTYVGGLNSNAMFISDSHLYLSLNVIIIVFITQFDRKMRQYHVQTHSVLQLLALCESSMRHVTSKNIKCTLYTYKINWMPLHLKRVCIKKEQYRLQLTLLHACTKLNPFCSLSSIIKTGDRCSKLIKVPFKFFIRELLVL